MPILRKVSRGHGLGVEQVLAPHRTQILRAAQQRGFGHVRVFGSVRRSEATRSSDIDLLVDRNAETSLLDRVALMHDLERILHRKVDVIPEEALHWLARPQVLFEAIPL
ncbi:MAG TPA: nucleotidyltransferase domain-containing protein [Thermoplasmata archaeon]|nr:nucleotidyltransferase domain-containing protein [Thermoplasmata archaeon]